MKRNSKMFIIMLTKVDELTGVTTTKRSMKNLFAFLVRGEPNKLNIYR